jgi:SsrA-binding protein
MKITNRKARFEYNIIKEYTAGIQLFGSEVKSIRNNDASISESFACILNGEIYVKGMHIGQFKGASRTHEELRDKKLLLNRKEIQSIAKNLTERGITLIPLEIFDLGGKIKLKVAIAKGKKLYDKKEALKERDIKIQTRQELSIK